MKKIIILNKKEGETPLQALESFRLKHKAYKDTKMTYAGRLDPMASGILLVLLGEETKNKEKYLALDKEYNFQILFGLATDTYDILGKITSSYTKIISEHKLKKSLKKEIKNFTGHINQKYPIYSSKTVKGKPLFTYARAGEEVDIPERKIFIKKLKLEKISIINNKKLLANVEKRIKKVKGDFRQEEILKTWKKSLQNGAPKFFLADLRIKCSSGTYVRAISDGIGKNIGIPALAFWIKRTRVGRYGL